MLTAACHCGRVRIEVARRPRTLCDCNCSICRRYGVLWAYYSPRTCRVVSGRRGLVSYVWGERRLKFFHCAHCGCVTHYEQNRKPNRVMALNARLLAPDAIVRSRIRHFDGAVSWKYLD